jgi:hypothetical protein
VDDLDRCEPENVLNLITALKLFFTYGEKTVFLSGIDKDAVTKAVKTKYRDVIKSEEYMEKVFDISFNMPKTFSLKKMLQPYFFDVTVRNRNAKVHQSTEVIEDFFKSINFTTPRHIKKVLNKYQILKIFSSLNLTGRFTRLIPDIINSPNNGKIFETIYCLFVIILYEFNPAEFEDVSNYEQKFIKYTEVFFNMKVRTLSSFTKGQAAAEIYPHLYITEMENLNYGQIIAQANQQSDGSVGFGRFLMIFSNGNPTTIGNLPSHELNRYRQYFTDDSISTKFCKFLIKYSDTIAHESEESDFKIANVFDMVKYLL